MYLLKEAYRIRRDNKEIYSAFGFKHLSNVTSHYVHKKNESAYKTTSLAQAIGEAIIYYYEIKNDFKNEDYENKGNIFLTEKGAKFYMTIKPKHLIFKTFPSNFHKIAAEISENNININIYDNLGSLIPFDEYYEIMISILVLFAYYIESEEVFKDENFNLLAKDISDFNNIKTATLFVKIHENFYQYYKNTYFKITSNKKVYFNNFIKNIGEYEHNLINKNKKQIKLNELSFDFYDEMLIPNFDNSFIYDENLIPCANSMVVGDSISMLFFGPSGTGKTISCKLMCQKMKLPVMSVINCTENLDEFILGKYIPIEDKIIFVESEVSKAIRDGGAVIFEEINFAKPAYLAFLNSLLDTNGFVRLDNGEIIRRHPNFRFFCTMNIGYHGTKEINQSLFNRFNIIYEVNELSIDSIKHLLLKRYPYCETDINSILSVYLKIKELIKQEELDYVISARNLENWVKLSKFAGYKKASNMTIISITKNDDYYKEIIKSFINDENWSI